jgi:hypothetical protein
MRRTISILGLCLVAATAGGCRKYKLEPPAGFAQVDADDWSARMKAGDDVGLHLRVFPNVDGGTLEFWAGDLVKKLGKRGYSLTAQNAAKSKNGVAGTRFDFDYTAPGTTEPKFYSATLFVSDKNVVVVQVAGDAQRRAQWAPKLDGIAQQTVVRGCKPGGKVCGGPQPGKLSSPPPDPILGLDPDEGPPEEDAPEPPAVAPAGS